MEQVRNRQEQQQDDDKQTDRYVVLQKDRILQQRKCSKNNLTLIKEIKYEYLYNITKSSMWHCSGM